MISSSLNRGVDSRRQQAIIEIDDAAEDKVHEMHQERDRAMKDVESAQTALRKTCVRREQIGSGHWSTIETRP